MPSSKRKRNRVKREPQHHRNDDRDADSLSSRGRNLSKDHADRHRRRSKMTARHRSGGKSREEYSSSTCRERKRSTRRSREGRNRRRSTRSTSRRRDRYESDDSSRNHHRQHKRKRRDEYSYSHSHSHSPSSRDRRPHRSSRTRSRRERRHRRDQSETRYDRGHEKRKRQQSRSRRRTPSSSSSSSSSRGRSRLRRRRTDRARARRRRSHHRRPIRHHNTARAGVVSDDDDTNPNADGDALGTKSPTSHEDTIGHYNGKEGAVIADRYRVLKEVGVGTFGRVLECIDLKYRRRDAHHKDIVAIKVVRNVKRYHESALIEANIIRDVNRHGGRGLSHCAVMHDAFSYHGHYCMVFESLGPSLYDFLKRHQYQPFPTKYVKDFATQLLETLEFLHSYNIIHTDLKLENLLLLNDREVTNKRGQKVPESNRIKVIDFGGATYDHDKKSSIVNTRQYRAPEVILGCGWSMPSDLWSLGCILMELYQGELLFPTHENIEHLGLIEKAVGHFPRRLLNRAKNVDLVNDAFGSDGKHRMKVALNPESLAYVKQVGPLESMVAKDDKWFLRLLRRVLVVDPEERATARECLRKL